MTYTSINLGATVAPTRRPFPDLQARMVERTHSEKLVDGHELITNSDALHHGLR